MKTIQDKIATTMQDATDCSQCNHRQTCDRTPLDNAWRELSQRCSLWKVWNG
jgi:hypothetical protein